MASRFSFLGQVERHQWLMDRYWVYAWSVLLLACPLPLIAAGKADVMAIGVYGLLNLAGWLLIRPRFPIAAIRIHLAALIPYWAWYAGLEGGLPERIAPGASTYVVLFFFPVLVTVAIDGWRGVALMAPLTGLLVGSRFGFSLEGLAGWFLCSTAMLVGMVFHHQTWLLQRANEQLVRLATHDPETDLANRRRLEAALESLGFRPAVLLLIELSRFKTIEDGFGRQTAVRLLRAVGERLLAETSEPVVLVHLGGDRFGMLIEGLGTESAVALASKLVDTVAKPFAIDSSSIQVKCRVGVAAWPHDDDGAGSLIRRAERAVDRGRKMDVPVMVYDPSLDPERDRELELELWRALAGGEIVPYFQPVFELGKQRLVGVEALARWNHPKRGIVGPTSFIETAESTGQILHLDRFMLERVVHQLELWHEAGIELWVAVNVSARTFDDGTFLDWMRELVRTHPVARSRVVLEITESAAMRDPERSALLLADLRELGFRVALDDFGVGHSSLAYLKRLPASHLKLDRSFVSGIGQSSGDVALLDFLVQLAEFFDLEVVAEGIEREEQLLWLQDRGCRLAQGFLLARPMPAAELTALARVSLLPVQTTVDAKTHPT